MQSGRFMIVSRPGVHAKPVQFREGFARQKLKGHLTPSPPVLSNNLAKTKTKQWTSPFTAKDKSAESTQQLSWGLIATQDVFERKDEDININAEIVIGCRCPDNQWLIWWLYSVSKAVVAIGGASQDAHPGVRHSCSPSVWLTAWWTEPGAAISLFYSQRTQTPNLKDGEEETREAEMFSPATPRTRPTRCFASCISKELRVDSC